jgi:hypothetical protein
MPETEENIGRRKTSFGAPGKKRPAVFALDSPKASAPKLHHRNRQNQNQKYKTLCQLLTEGLSRFLRSQPRRIGLGSPRQARPRHGPDQRIMGGRGERSKPELSILLESGTFYFALTTVRLRRQRSENCPINPDDSL